MDAPAVKVAMARPIGQLLSYPTAIAAGDIATQVMNEIERHAAANEDWTARKAMGL